MAQPRIKGPSLQELLLASRTQDPTAAALEGATRGIGLSSQLLASQQEREARIADARARGEHLKAQLAQGAETLKLKKEAQPTEIDLRKAQAEKLRAEAKAPKTVTGSASILNKQVQEINNRLTAISSEFTDPLFDAVDAGLVDQETGRPTIKGKAKLAQLERILVTKLQLDQQAAAKIGVALTPDDIQEAVRSIVPPELLVAEDEETPEGPGFLKQVGAGIERAAGFIGRIREKVMGPTSNENLVTQDPDFTINRLD